MYVVCVHVHVKSDRRDDFVAATRENAGQSVHEPGNLRFDVNRQVDDPNRFVLYEVYRDEAGAKAHKETPHYNKWRETVAPWMAEQRRGVEYAGLFPESQDEWETHAG